jgi:uncharacterized protein (DUF1800 family)
MISSMYYRSISTFALFVAMLLPRSMHADVIPPTSVVSLVLIDGDMREDWPDAGVVGVRRTETTGALTVNFTISGTATRNTDYAMPAGNSITIPDGDRETWLSFSPLTDTLNEPVESLTVTLQPGSGYLMTSEASQTRSNLTLSNASATKPCAKAAARFLIQASFGPDSDSSTDADIIPQNVQSVMSLGFENWIKDQLRRPLGLHQPYLDWMKSKKQNVNWDAKAVTWWNRAMGVPALYPGGRAQASDPLRQRMAFALSEIFVISDHMDVLGNQAIGMENYYDMLVRHSFGNFRNLLFDVATHPCMGTYLSHLKNRKADPVAGTFPDQNFAREIMQLFTIGLWQLNPNGTRTLDGMGQPIPTYDNDDIAEFARVFTGLSFGGKVRDEFEWPDESYVTPMFMWDEYHDVDAKTLLNGTILPPRTASTAPDRGTAGMDDLNAAIDCLFNHPNTGPFICRQLIQRFVTSNPSPAYVGRVAAIFANNGKSVRGDLAAVIKAILLDSEARDPAMLANANFGKIREPYLRTVNLARALNAAAKANTYRLSYLDQVLAQQPLSAPSVFNFFKPGYAPPGPVNDAGLVAPEFQILNAITSLSTSNYYYNVIRNDFGRWGESDKNYKVTANITAEKALYRDVPALMRRLDLVLTAGTLPPEQHQIIREAVEDFSAVNGQWQWFDERIYSAIYLISTSPEFAVLR